MWNRKRNLSWNRNQFDPTFGKAHWKSRSLNPVVWKPDSFNQLEKFQTFFQDWVFRQETFLGDFGLRPFDKLHNRKGKNLECWLKMTRAFGKLSKSLKDTSSGKVSGKTERTTQRFMPQKARPESTGLRIVRNDDSMPAAITVAWRSD